MPGAKHRSVCLSFVRSTVVLWVFLLGGIAAATARTIHVEYGETYQEDTLVLKLNTDSPEFVEGDTAYLPSGVVLEVRSMFQQLPPDGWSYAGIMAHQVSSREIGYRPCSTFTYLVYVPGIGTGATVGNPDTIWEEARAFPDSLYMLDYHGSEDDTFFTKWCMSERDTSYLPNWQAIIYLRGSDSRHLKLQALGVPEDSLAYAYWWSTAFRIRWAVDSAGNGLFRHDVSGVESSGRSQPPPRAAHGPRLGVELFDLHGARVAEYGPAGRRRASGVVVTQSGAAAACRVW